MKKIIVSFILILSLVIFNKTIISQVIIFTTSKLSDKNISIKNIDIDYSKKQLTLNSIQVKNTSKIYYENIFEAEKVKIKYNFKSLFTDLIIIDHLSFYNSKIFVDIEIKDGVITNDNLEEVKKNKDNYKPKIYPIKKKDINFLILKLETHDTQGFIKTSRKSNEIKINLSNISFNKIGNKTGFQHYKKVFKIVLGDIFLKVPGIDLKNLIKKTYKLQHE
ncbi:hypothetical protein [Candidatus Pelagibacter sp. Uisw_127]|uniref:hypothetical protein n=1 Tax=Candidatus Pelagibacter sp. Uisw_127 TaxID=3230988 RepID=UPI0039E8ADAB